MQLGITLAYLQPQGGYDVRVPEGGTEPYIAHWDDSFRPQPTQAELEAAYPDALREQKRAEIRAGLVRDCEAIMPIYELVYCLRARVSDPRLSGLDALAKRVRDLEAYIDNPARTVAELETVDWGAG